ncbi:hypothetical protein BC831DRAFT_451963 [Entophlyctis helioformis]|nr:hypothetical protein BC831DRAFT_451963 [Entophlyctis helioformis]
MTSDDKEAAMQEGAASGGHAQQPACRSSSSSEVEDAGHEFDAAELAALEAEAAAVDQKVQQLLERKQALLRQTQLRDALRRKQQQLAVLEAEISKLEHDLDDGDAAIKSTRKRSKPDADLPTDLPANRALEQTVRSAIQPSTASAASVAALSAKLKSTLPTTLASDAIIKRNRLAMLNGGPPTISPTKQPQAVAAPQKRSLSANALTASSRPVYVMTSATVAHIKEVQASVSASVEDSAPPVHVETESISGLRVKNRLVPETNMQARMQGRQYVPLSKLSEALVSDDVEGDWVVIGVIVHKGENKTTKSGDPFISMRVSDLRGTMLNVLMFRDVHQAHWKEKVGSIVAILNPSILKATEVHARISLNVDDARKWMKIGDAADLAFCRGTRRDKQTCANPIDRYVRPQPCALVSVRAYLTASRQTIQRISRRGQYCEEHTTSAYRASRMKRQEFASGTGGFVVGVPGANNDRQKRSAHKPVSADGTYVLDGQTISVSGNNVSIALQKRVSDRPVFDEEQKRKIQEFLQSNTPGGKCLRALHNIPEPQAKEVTLFGPNALARMGGNPITGDGLVPKSGLASPKGSPSSRRTVSMPVLKDTSAATLSSAAEAIKHAKLQQVMAAAAERQQLQQKQTAAAAACVGSESDIELEIEDD